ncbi:hypothetical protein WJX72_010359 [[Myrmecia] bisecta]|uniref:Uncharacterized protein n=1 Tax=[Myrmecia] bisecta TaxID=41462 RepID=A0AAW1PYB0_9CHLO
MKDGLLSEAQTADPCCQQPQQAVSAKSHSPPAASAGGPRKVDSKSQAGLRSKRQPLHRRLHRTGWQHRLDEAVNYGKHLLSGALAAAVCRTSVAPLERIKLELVLHQKQGSWQTAKEILAHDGVLGFWRGNMLNILRSAPHKAINFFSFDCYRKTLLHMSGNTGMHRTERFAAGAMAGATATALCFPLDVLRTRIMGPGAHRHGGVLSTLVSIVRNEGVQALYVGCLPAIMTIAPSGAIYYGVYDVLKESHFRNLRKEHGLPEDVDLHEHLGAARMLLYGALAGAAAESALYPMEVIRRRMQLHSLHAAAGNAPRLAAQAGAKAAARSSAVGLVSFMAAAREILQEAGLRGFYAGLIPNTLQVLPNAALSYFAYETFKQMLQVQE